MKNYTLVVWPGTLVDPGDEEEFITFLMDTFKCRFKYEGTFNTKPTTDPVSDGGRTEQLFWVHNCDISKFAIPRLKYRISWWEDYRPNNLDFIPPHILEKYKGEFHHV